MENTLPDRPEPAQTEVFGFVNGHALRSNPGERLVTLCGLQLMWGRVKAGILPKCKKCREIMLNGWEGHDV